MQFPAGTYLVRTLNLHSQCTYTGNGATLVLIAPNQFIFDISEQSNLHISGFAFDGNGQGGAIIAQGFAPASNILIENCQFRNIVAAARFPANQTIVSTWGFVNSAIQNNSFSNISGGIWLTAIENVSVLNNSFQNVTQSTAIYVAPSQVSFQSGDNLRIAGNSGSHIAQMAIEIFKPDTSNGSVLTAPIIENNTFSDWTGSNGTGLSITHGDGAIIRGNQISNTNGPMQSMGIEIIVANAQVSGNVVNAGFALGIVVQGTAAPSITDNTISSVGDTAILLACANNSGRCASRNAVITNNKIQNARLVGIKLDNDWSGGHVMQNTITRTSGAWNDDGTILFSGIHQSPAPGPATIALNTVVQDASNVVPGFWFCGVRVNSQMPGSILMNNIVQSLSSRAFGSGLIDNTGNATQGWNIFGNQYINIWHDVN